MLDRILFLNVIVLLRCQGMTFIIIIMQSLLHKVLFFLLRKQLMHFYIDDFAQLIHLVGLGWELFRNWYMFASPFCFCLLKLFLEKGFQFFLFYVSKINFIRFLVICMAQRICKIMDFLMIFPLKALESKSQAQNPKLRFFRIFTHKDDGLLQVRLRYSMV